MTTDSTKTKRKTKATKRTSRAATTKRTRGRSDKSTADTPTATSAVAQVDVAEVAATGSESRGQAAEAPKAGTKTAAARRRRGRTKRTTSRPGSVATEPDAQSSDRVPEATGEGDERPTTESTSGTTPATSPKRRTKRRKMRSRRDSGESAERHAGRSDDQGRKAETDEHTEDTPPARDAATKEDSADAPEETSDKPDRSSKTRASRGRGTRGGAKRGKRSKSSDQAKAKPQTADTRTAARSTRAGRKKPADDDNARKMLINVFEGDECRIAVLLGNRLEELFMERAATLSHVGNIYKGRVTNIEPSIQAAFIDFGLPQNGFLHISDVQPQYFPGHKGEVEQVGRKIPRHSRPRIQDCFRRGNEVIVQVTREGVGTKGPTLTTYPSIPGRFLVMMPGMNRHGVSRKIEDEADRRTMRDLLKQLDLPSGMGFILRTAGLGRTNRELQRDLNYLMRLWKTVVDRIKNNPAPAELYRESDLVTRTLRDVYTTDFTKLVVDDPDTAERAREFLQIAMPRAKPVIEVYSDREPLFHHFGIEEEIDRINMRHVPLPSGGSLVIDSTEALVAIDVNSGRGRVGDDADETIFMTNLEAADEIARQLRLRDLGGLIVCDFIDMRHDKQKRAVEKAMRDALKQHKERARALRISAFGLMEITRQRQGPSLKRNIYSDCPHCKGTGLVKMPDSVTLDVMRILQLATSHKDVQRVTVSVAGNVAFQILNDKRSALSQLEADTGKRILIRGAPGFTSDQVSLVCEDSRGQTVNALPARWSLTESGTGGR